MIERWFASNNIAARLNSNSLKTRIILLAVAAALVVAGLLLVPRSQRAATPASGTIDPVMGITSLSYTGGPFNQPNVSPVPQVDSGPRCNGNTNPCDSYALTVNLPAGYNAAHNNPAVKVALSWTDGGSGKSDYDLWIFNGNVGTLSGSSAGSSHSASSKNPEVATVFPLTEGSSVYTIKVVPFTPSGETIHVNIQLVDGLPPTVTPPGLCDSLVFGGPDKTCVGNPRYQNFYAPAGSSAEASRGEFNIGFDPITHRIMTMNAGPIWRLTPGEVQVPAKPECCEALWEDKSTPVLDNPSNLDPILWTDQKTGRTFGSNSTAGANADYAYTDAAAPFNDGDQWVPVAISPPNGGVDHETIGSGPYPLVAGLPNPLATPVNQGEMVFYSSQALVGSQCQRSDTLGASYGPAVPATGPPLGSQGCGGLHGHLHVAPDGTVWLPDNSCNNGKQGGAISTDSGVTWTEFLVSGNNDVNGNSPFASSSQADGADPSVGIDSASTAYYCYVNNENNGTEGHVHVAVGKRTGSNISWIRDVDVGASHGIINAALTEAVGGSNGRAACGFVGTNVSGNYQLGAFTGVWYAYIATTYDEGRTWVTVNATPNDPVQNHTGIWQQGGSGQNGDRNLLDFNEITVDDKGRVLYGYSDGCHSLACITGDNSRGERGGFMRVARQSGGKPLLSQFDSQFDTTTAALPKPACLSGARDCAAARLTWKAPDNRGSDVINYQIFRGTAPGTEVLIGETGDAKTAFDDTTINSSTAHYYYLVKAINGIGTGPQSNELDLSAGTVAVDDTAITPENHAVTIDVLGNDCGSPPLTVTSVGTPAHGAANNNGNGTVTYTPAAAFFGSDSFTYTIHNGLGVTASATIHITVNPLCALFGIGSFSDTLEPGAKPGWTMDTAVNNIPTSQTWNVMVDPGAHSPTHSFFSDATTLDLKDDRLVTPPQKLSSTSHLIFWHRYQFEDGFDGGALEVSTDGGTTWVDVLAGGGSFVSGGYNGTISASIGW